MVTGPSLGDRAPQVGDGDVAAHACSEATEPEALEGSRPTRSTGPGEFRDPVRFPGLPVVDREGLLPAGTGRGDIRPDVVHADRSAFMDIGAREHPAAVVTKPADHRRERKPRPATGPVERPFVACRV